jgi:amino acid transporter
MSVLDFILGRRLASSEEPQQRLGPIRGIPIFGLDALSSAAYGPEAALTVLLPAGVAGLVYVLPLTSAVILVLTIVYFSYRQTIAAYPTGGGSYTVARANLGARAGLVAAAALMIDYILNVAVAISSGVGALISAIPSLQPYTLTMCLAILCSLCLVNLRGLRETGSIFLIPTTLFVACLFTVIAIGIMKRFWPGEPDAIVHSSFLPQSQQAVTTWLLLKAFASGCTALTGVEAVSNGVQAFREPVVVNARRCLTAIVLILIVLLAGVGYLTHAYQILARPPGEPGYESILSQMTRTVAGGGWFYQLTIASILIVLTCSANTSFADFPRVCRALAVDGYLPQSFANRGRRLVYSEGTIVLTILSAILLWAFGGITDRLIPLFAVGAFVAFTFSQAGMVMHWNRNPAPGARRKQIMNAVGAITTGCTTVIIAVAKFAEGAWVSILLFICLFRLMTAVKKHYDELEREVDAPPILNDCAVPNPIVVVPAEKWNRVTRRAILFAFSISSDVKIVHVTIGEEKQTDKATDVKVVHSNPGYENQNEERADAQMARVKPMEEEQTEEEVAQDPPEGEAQTDTVKDPDKVPSLWYQELKRSAEKAGCPVPSLTTLPSPYRLIIDTIIEHVLELERRHPDRTIAVVIPELVEPRWYYYFLHNQRGKLLAARLLFEGDRRIVVVNVPWNLKE